MLSIQGITKWYRGISSKWECTSAFSLVFYNMLLIKNLKPEEQDFIWHKKMCQSWGLGEKMVCQTLRGPHWPKYKIVNSNPTLTDQKGTLGTQTFSSAKTASVPENERLSSIFHRTSSTMWCTKCSFLGKKYMLCSVKNMLSLYKEVVLLWTRRLICISFCSSCLLEKGLARCVCPIVTDLWFSHEGWKEIVKIRV